MSERIEIAKPVKLTAAQRIALVAAANADGVLQNAEYGVRETLRYLGLVQRLPLHSKLEMDRIIEKAWSDLRGAVRDKNVRRCEEAVNIIRSEQWEREKMVWRITPAANEYLLNGRVLVTVGDGRQVQKRERLSA